MSMLLASRMPAACPCCWDTQGQGCGTALCMPFEYISATCPKMNFSGFTCRNAVKPPWVVPSYTPVCKATWDTAHGDQPCIYGSGPIPNADCNCIGYFAQYCIEDVNGNRGRSWVVQYWCYNSDTGTATTTSVVVQDWECRCVGARYAFNLGVSGCCCECGPPDCTCTPPSTLYVDVTGCGSCWDVSGAVLTYDAGSDSWITSGEASACINAISLKCEAGEWKITIAPIPAECTNQIVAAASGTCSPLSLTFSVPLDSTCYPPSGCTLTVTVSE